MKIKPEWLTAFAYELKTTCRIEAITVVDKYQKKATGPDYPDEWFIKLNSDACEIYYPHLTRGIYTLTRQGWEANIGLIKSAFDDGRQAYLARGTYNQPRTWLQYETYVGHEFARIESLIKSDVMVLAESLKVAQENYKNLMGATVNPQQDIVFLKADRNSVLRLLSTRTFEDDPIGYGQYQDRLQEITDQLMNLGVTDFT